MPAFIMIKKLVVGFSALVVTLIIYYVVSSYLFFAAARQAFPNLPILDECHHIPWPVGPMLVGHVAPDDPLYVNRHETVKESNGLTLIIHDSDGTIVIQ